jgi:signal transduction histidine kinase
VRTRLMLCYSALLAAVLVGLVVPLASSTITRKTQAVFIDRLDDANRFASLADTALRSNRSAALAMELSQYHATYGIDVLVVDRNGVTVLAEGGSRALSGPAVRRSIQLTLSGERSGVNGPLWPWQSGPLIVAEPVGHGGEIIGGVLTVSPVPALQASGWRCLGLLSLCGTLVMMAGLAVGQPLVRWILRPVADLDATVSALPKRDGRPRLLTPASGPPELRRLVASVNRMGDRITELTDRQASFVSYAGHQLRTPLASLRIALDNLAPPAGESDRSHEIAVLEAERSAAIIDSLLSYASANARAADAHVIDAVRAARELVAARQPVAEAAGVPLDCVGAGPRWVMVAPTVLEQAVDVLVDNALRHGETSTRIRVEVAQPDPGWVEIAVSDDGIGLPEEALARAAEPFWQHPGRRADDGIGLGLTIIDALVRASGGGLRLSAAGPAGLRATVRLPAAPAGPHVVGATP